MQLKDYLNFYFSFKGRATRYDFNIRFALMAFVGMFVAYTADCIRIGGVVFDQSELVFSNWFNLLVFFSGFALVCRRLHDMNFSGWWQVPVHFVSAGCVGLLVAIFGMVIFLNPLLAGLGGFIAMLAVLVIYLLFFIFLSAKRGTIGPNQYGPDPLQTIETIQ